MRDLRCGAVRDVAVGGPSHQVIFRERTAAKSPGFRKADILLAEDDPIVRKFLTAALTAEGYHIFQACDGLEAILLWHERKPIDLIIADVNMPGLTGPLLAEAIWVEEYTPVLYISGLPPEGLTALHIEDGRARFLRKPFQVGALSNNVRALVEARRAFKAAQ